MFQMTDLKILIAKCKNKDIRAEYELYKECFALLIGICKRYTVNKDDAVDLLNRAFLKILNNLKKYDENKPFNKWVKSIMINTIIDEFRKAKNYKELFSKGSLDDLPLSKHPFDLNEAEEKLDAIDILKEIKRLPQGCKEVFNLFVFEGLNHREISKSLQIAESTSRWHLAKARTLLKERFTILLSAVKKMAI